MMAFDQVLSPATLLVGETATSRCCESKGSENLTKPLRKNPYFDGGFSICVLLYYRRGSYWLISIEFLLLPKSLWQMCESDCKAVALLIFRLPFGQDSKQRR